MQPFATADDLQRGWRTLSQAERATASELLARASAQIVSLLRPAGIAIDPEDEVQATNLKTVACNMVRRAMGPSGADGIASMSQTVGSTSASVTWGNPDGAFYLSKNDREALGLVSGGSGRTIMPAAYAEAGGE